MGLAPQVMVADDWPPLTTMLAGVAGTPVGWDGWMEGRGVSAVASGGAPQASSDSAEQAQQQASLGRARHAQHGFAQQVTSLPTVTTSESAAAEMLVGPPTATTSNLYCPGTWGSWLQLGGKGVQTVAGRGAT